MGASNMTFSGHSDPAMLEAMACREALVLAEDLGKHMVHVALDFLEIINNLKRDFIGSYSFVPMKIKRRAGQFESASFKHENMSSNGGSQSRSIRFRGFGCVRKVDVLVAKLVDKIQNEIFHFFSCLTIYASMCFGCRGAQSSSKPGSSATTESTVSPHASIRAT